jgi:formamidopyrimidine-DNA glycosylase
MPELPEVETVVRGLERELPGRVIIDVRLGKTDFIEDPVALLERLPGARIRGARRAGKFLYLELDSARDAGGNFCLLVHLGMTGQFTIRRAGEFEARHTHATFSLDDGRELRYTDARRFGRILIVSPERLREKLSLLGSEPLEATFEEFRARLAKRRARVKALLLDQRVFRGLGNIYCDEGLWRARIHPARLGASLREKELRRLYAALRRVLTEAIRLRGSSFSDYVDADGRPGEFQLRHRVYQREGKPCPRCGAAIRRGMVAGRSSYHCPKCQRAPRGFGKRHAS